MNIRAFGRLATLAIACSLVVTVQAQEEAAKGYPSRTVRLIEGSGPGSMTDTIARGLAQSLTQMLAQPVVVDNRPGANGIVAMELCSKSAPDGYTLCLPNSSQISINPFVYAKLPYDPVRDFAPVINMGFINGVILVHPSVPAKTMRELIDLAKAKPGALNWATFGIGSFTHLTLAWVQSNTGASFFHIPYKASFQALQAVIAGEAQVTQNNLLNALPMIKAGKLKALVLAGHERSAILPGVPSFTEEGFELDFAGWNGIFAPAGTPKAIVQRLNAEVAKLIADPRFVERFLAPFGVGSPGGSPEEFAAFLRSDRETAAKVVKFANIQPQ